MAMTDESLRMLLEEMTENVSRPIPSVRTVGGDLEKVGAWWHLYIYRPSHEGDKTKWEVMAGQIDTGSTRLMTSDLMADALGLRSHPRETVVLAAGETMCNVYGPCYVRLASMKNRFYSKPVLIDRVSTTSEWSYGPVDALIGRDVLGHFDLEYSGRQGRAVMHPQEFHC